jgi:AcrR family transcriptional regulator
MTGNKSRLSKTRIVDAAIAYADVRGAEALTMRRVAEEIGCGVMSLYTHVANKDAMLVEMVDRIVGEIELPVDGGDWKASLRANAVSANIVLLRHPWAVGEWTRRMPGPLRTQYMEALLRVLTEGGLPPELVYRGYHAVTMHIVGFTQQQIAYQSVLDGSLPELAKGFLDSLAGDFPYLAVHVGEHLDCTHDEDEFGRVFDLILDGLELAASRLLET